MRHTASNAKNRKQCEKPQAMRHTASNAPHRKQCATPHALRHTMVSRDT
jgi:hypothetical protein